MPACNASHPTIKRDGKAVRCVLEKGHDDAHTSAPYVSKGKEAIAFDGSGLPTKFKDRRDDAVDQWVGAPEAPEN